MFLDASVLVAASRSPLGGSALAMEVCSGREFRATLTNRVLLEVRRNIAEKFGEQELLRFYRQIAAMDPEMVAPPSTERVEECVPLTTEKDAHSAGGGAGKWRCIFAHLGPQTPADSGRPVCRPSGRSAHSRGLPEGHRRRWSSRSMSHQGRSANGLHYGDRG